MTVPLTHLDRALRKGPPGCVAAALDAMTVANQPAYAVVAEVYLDDPDPRVRTAALRAASVLGSSRAWPMLVRIARDDSPPFAGELVAMLGSPTEQDAILDWARQHDSPEHALWCLGLTGRRNAAEIAASRLDDERPRVAKLAFEAFRGITGLLAGQAFVEPVPRDEGAIQPEDLSADPIDALPMPHVHEVRAWWAEHRGGLEHGVRYLNGETRSAANLRDALLHGPARRRHALALELAARSHGACLVPTRSWSWRQGDAISSIQEPFVTGRIPTR